MCRKNDDRNCRPLMQCAICYSTPLDRLPGAAKTVPFNGFFRQPQCGSVDGYSPRQSAPVCRMVRAFVEYDIADMKLSGWWRVWYSKRSGR